ncbi:MAG: hypothetical protein IKA17_07315 [Clostridia bacterium]|nr:hypothetical protein [Clostridia bacterium]
MSKKEKKVLSWVRLDNAAKIYPAARRRNWTNLFRQSASLKEDIDKEVLSSALEVVVKRFPTIAARLRKGVFWYYLQELEMPPEIVDEYSYPLTYMDKKEIRECAFRVIVYKNRIAVEFFHSLTDGTGALVFLKNLVCEYIEQKYGINVPCEYGIVDRKEKPRREEIEDCFLKVANTVPLNRKDTNAWHMEGTPEPKGFLNLTCFKLPVKDILDKAHEYNTTVTIFLSAVMMKALLNMQKEKTPSLKKQKPVKLLIPVNLRSLFPCNTLRNFAMFTIPEIDPRLGDFTFDEIIKVIYHKMGTEVTAKHMARVIAANVKDEKNLFLRVVPLPIKNIVMKAVFDSVGERKACLNLSNLGLVKLPDIMKKYVTRMDFILGVQAAAPYNCGVLTYEDTVYVNFIRNISSPDLERHFHSVLREMGIEATLESNRKEN